MRQSDPSAGSVAATDIDQLLGTAVSMRIVCNFTVPGEPVPKGRPRFNFKTGRVYTPERTGDAEKRIAEYLKVRCPDLERATGRVKFKAVFYMKDGRQGDWDNYAKLVSDALNGKAWVDDKQIVQAEVLLIRESGNPHIDIIVYEFTPLAAGRSDAAEDSSGDEMTQLVVADQGPIIEQVMLKGDLKELAPQQRVAYYREVCRSLGLNELTRPFEYIVLNGKLTLYARKDCTDQLRGIRSVSITKLERERIDDLYVVTAYASDKNGRQDSAIGAVHVKGLVGEALANALMKAETKAKRRVTLSLCGLGWSDETEVGDIPSAQTIVVDASTGEVIEERKSSGVPMITSVDDKVYQRYVGWTERAAALEIEYEAYGVPVERQKVFDEAVRLKGLVEAAERQPEPVA